jgi:L-lysine 2,3-aminomutase
MKPVRPLRGRFTHARVAELLLQIHGEEEFAEMQAAGVDKRMMFGTNPHYQALVMGEELRAEDGSVLVPEMPPSKPVGALILPRLNETFDLEGAKDPSNQMNYTPKVDDYHGKLLHKYDEIVLGYASPVCSAHCRYCYRLDLFNGDTGKVSAQPEVLRDYIIDYNETLAANGGVDPETGKERFPIRELLLSGGDPLVLTNAMLYRFLFAAGQAGVNIIRIGSKEWAFRPERFDDALAGTFDLIHELFPDLHINMAAHLTHPDEFLERDRNGNYIPNESGSGYRWMTTSREAVEKMASRPFISIENQTPMISKVNDDVRALRILHEEMRRMNIKPKYVFQGRDIEGHKAFSVPVEEAWKIHNDAMKGTSDAARSRYAMATTWGKVEVVSVTDPLEMPAEALQALPGPVGHLLKTLLGDGLTIFRVHRSPFSAETQGDLIIAKRNPEALWLSGYEDRILYDTRVGKTGKYDGLFKLLADALGDMVDLDALLAPQSEEPRTRGETEAA